MDSMLVSLAAQGSTLETTLTSLDQKLDTSPDASTSVVMRRIAEVEREIIANDSFDEARSSLLLAEISRRFTDQSEQLFLVRSEAERRSTEYNLIREDIQSLKSQLNEIASEMSSAMEDGSKRSTRLDQRLSRYERALEDVNLRMESLAVSRADLAKLNELVNSSADRLESLVRKANTGIERSTGSAADRIANTENKIGKKISAVGDFLADKIDSGAKRTSLRMNESVDSVAERIDEANRAIGELPLLLDKVRREGVNAQSSAQEAYTRVSDGIERIDRQLISLSEARPAELRHLREVLNSRLDEAMTEIATNSRIVDLQKSIQEDFESLSSRTQNLFNATQSKLNQLRVAAEEMPKEVSDFAALLKQFEVDSTSTPRVGGWAATVPAIRTIVGEIVRNDQVRTVLDVGSGTSTFWSALAFRERGYGKCFALEHDEIYVDRMNSVLEAHGLGQWAEVVHAPLVPWKPSFNYPVSSDHMPDRWYATSSIPDVDFDIVFVDGPPGHAHEFSRLPALEILAPRLRDGSMIVLDDTIRVEEKGILKLWQDIPSDIGRIEVEDSLSKSAVLRFTSDSASVGE
ncbi:MULTISPECIES: class I SAM-dependent methyltransferase [Brevibacterium]|nr:MULTISPECIES: class I SAM-dependent methyltransferase [Brevibacterium]